MRTNFDISEKEIESTTKNINIENIRNLTFQKIDIAQKKEKTKLRLRKSILIASIIAIFLVTTSLAHQKGYLNKFWDDFDYNIKEEQFSPFSYEQVSDGIKMTVTDILQSRNEAIIFVAYERLDGKPFPKELTEIEKDNFDYSDKSLRGHTRYGNYIDDNKKLIYCYEINGENTPLAGKNVIMNSSGIVSYNNVEKEFNLNILKQYNNYPINISSDCIKEIDDMEFSLNRELTDYPFSYGYDILYNEFKKQYELSEKLSLPLENEYPEYTFLGVGYIRDKLTFAMYYPNSNDMIDKVYVTKLIDTRNNNVYELPSERREYKVKNGYLYICIIEDKKGEISKDDLNYLKPILNYVKKDYISKGNWSFSYTFDETNNIEIDKDIKQKHIQDDGSTFELTNIDVTVLGTYIYGQWLECENKGVPVYRPNVKFIMKDGKEIVLKIRESVITSDDSKFKYVYSIPSDDKDSSGRRFIDQEFMDNIDYIIVDDNEIEI